MRLLTLPSLTVTAEISTGESGEFEFQEVSTGRYQVSASKSGYVDVLKDAAERRLVISKDKAVHGLELRLLKTGVICGRVLDASGRPAQSARVVRVVRSGPPDSPRFLPVLPVATVDDQGNYRLFGLLPGRHRIAAIPSPSVLQANVWLPVYFPGVVDPNRALPVVLRAGETNCSINLLVTGAPGVTVSGLVTGLPTASASPVAEVALYARGLGTPLARVRTDAKGRFQFEAVPFGSFELVAVGPAIGIGGMGPVLGANPRYGKLLLEVVGQQVDDLEIALQDASALEGSLFAEEGSPAGATCYSAATVSLEPLDHVPPGPQLVAPIDNQGRFRFPALAPARYRVYLDRLADGCFLKEVRFGNDTRTDHTIVPGQNARLALVLTGESGAIEGTVTSGETPVASATVIAAPVSSGGVVELRNLSIASSDAEGRFRLARLALGRYRIMALSDMKSSDYMDEAFWSAHNNEMADLVVESSQTESTALRVLQPSEDWR